MAQQNKVAVNLAQDFTDEQKLQGRQNIGASQISYNNAVTDMTVSKEVVRPYMNTKYSATVGSDSFLLLPSTFADGMVVKSNGSLQTQTIPTNDFAFAEYGTTTFSEIQSMRNAGKQVIMTSSGRLAGFYMYSTETQHVFQYFYADPVRFNEYFCDNTNQWTNYTHYATDLRSLPQYCYYREQIGTWAVQGTVSDNPTWLMWPSTGAWYDMAGTEKTGASQRDLLKSYSFPRTCRFGASGTIQLQADAVINQSVSIVARLKLSYAYRLPGSTSYVWNDIPYWEGQLYTFTNFRDISTGNIVRSLSDPIQMNAIADLSQNVWKAYANNTNYEDFFLSYRLNLVDHGIPSSVTTVWIQSSGLRESLAIMI